MISETAAPETADPSAAATGWREVVMRYQKSSPLRAMWQVVNSFGLYVATWGLIYWSLPISRWLTAALTLLAGGVLMRVFIILHDCGHGSFFKSRLANDITGYIGGVLTFTPYHLWRWEHAQHHSASGDLDRRGIGDIPTLTVEEYLSSPRLKRWVYRLVRNPIVLFGVIPLLMFFIKHRLPMADKASAKIRHSVHWTNLGILVMVVGLSLLFGFWTYLIIQVSVIMITGSVGTWLFYVQHQFEDVYWGRGEEWDFVDAALKGSSFYKLPKVLQWFTGNIGFHHIHHLSPRIPNY
ncbi:MAG: fatty acid desaturase, partial [Verrucomicrobiota bacterium]